MALSHYLMGKNVFWNTLERYQIPGKEISYRRVINIGTVKDVSSCGKLCLVVAHNGVHEEVETFELEVYQ